MKLKGIIPYLCYTSTMKYQFYRTHKLYWNTKYMLAMGMQLKNDYIFQLEQEIETLEEKNAYLQKVVKWMASKMGGLFEHLANMIG